MWFLHTPASKHSILHKTSADYEGKINLQATNKAMIANKGLSSILIRLQSAVMHTTLYYFISNISPAKGQCQKGIAS